MAFPYVRMSVISGNIISIWSQFLSCKDHESALKICSNLRFTVHVAWSITCLSRMHYQIISSGKLHAIYMRTGFDKEVKRISHSCVYILLDSLSAEPPLFDSFYVQLTLDHPYMFSSWLQFPYDF